MTGFSWKQINHKSGNGAKTRWMACYTYKRDRRLAADNIILIDCTIESFQNTGGNFKRPVWKCYRLCSGCILYMVFYTSGFTGV